MDGSHDDGGKVRALPDLAGFLIGWIDRRSKWHSSSYMTGFCLASLLVAKGDYMRTNRRREDLVLVFNECCIRFLLLTLGGIIYPALSALESQPDPFPECLIILGSLSATQCFSTHGTLRRLAHSLVNRLCGILAEFITVLRVTHIEIQSALWTSQADHYFGNGTTKSNVSGKFPRMLMALGIDPSECTLGTERIFGSTTNIPLSTEGIRPRRSTPKYPASRTSLGPQNAIQAVHVAVPIPFEEKFSSEWTLKSIEAYNAVRVKQIDERYGHPIAENDSPIRKKASVKNSHYDLFNTKSSERLETKWSIGVFPMPSDRFREVINFYLQLRQWQLRVRFIECFCSQIFRLRFSEGHTSLIADNGTTSDVLGTGREIKGPQES
ncbi:uncharacterized protein EV420DRAFT_1476694 [Desarmillaria tabescens]|uniref:Uncharacterized protein n=1 Tax=Armillaria tabescens TaxID=1929756 RepID=A0AA39T3Z4_ARMTA|nr:uncharacterized protein EV420DRAFT_1476694 [Desarmillaria tabescens]KAK0462911.1 hypothetical protein EV420DRAFT_1476694 [Desarmillaria tabescens]